MSQFSHFYFTPVYCKNYQTINLIYIKSVNPRLLGLFSLKVFTPILTARRQIYAIQNTKKRFAIY